MLQYPSEDWSRYEDNRECAWWCKECWEVRMSEVVKRRGPGGDMSLSMKLMVVESDRLCRWRKLRVGGAPQEDGR